jgi:hypothetical protein
VKEKKGKKSFRCCKTFYLSLGNNSRKKEEKLEMMRDLPSISGQQKKKGGVLPDLSSIS